MIIKIIKFLLKPFLKNISFDKDLLLKEINEKHDETVVLIARRRSYISAAYFQLMQEIYFRNKLIYISGFNSQRKLNSVIENKGIIFLFLEENKKPNRFIDEYNFIHTKGEFKAMPLFILWVKRVQYTNNLEAMDYPRGFYKLFLSIFLSKKASLRTCKYLYISSKINAEDFYKKVLASYQQQMISILGPRIRSRSEIIKEILRDKDFVKEISRLQPKKTLIKAKEILNEIATNKRFSMIRKLSKFMDFVWRFTIEGMYVDEKGLNKVKEIAKTNQIVYLPSHKSHADYLLIGQQLYKYDLDTPLTAAGVNLSFFPIGNLFRRSGAFFIRRSFRGNRFYSSIFLKYLETMLIEGASQMFYIEGGRSRTGKMLSPKLGMLTMMLSVIRLGKVKDLYFVPMSVDYGKLFEGQSYIEELQGKNKQKESIFAMFDTFKFFKKRQGITYLQFAEPFSVINYFKDRDVDILTVSDQEFSKVVEDMGEHIIHQINSVVTITPSSIISLTLLANFRRGIQKNELMRICKLIFHYLKTKDIRLPSLEENFEKNFTNVLHNFEYNGYVKAIPYINDQIIRLNEDSRPFLDYYKNNIIHLFLQMSFVSIIIRFHETEDLTVDEIIEKLDFFKHLFVNEFNYSELAWNRKNIIETIKFLGLVRTIKYRDNKVTKLIDHKNWLNILGNIVYNYFESYFTVADYLTNKFGSNQETDLKDILIHGQNLYEIGIINMSESISKENYQNALKYIRRNNVLQSKESIQKFRDSLLRYLI